MTSRIRKIIEHTTRFGFINESLGARAHQKCFVVDSPIQSAGQPSMPQSSTYEYGPFGSQMRKNILDLWWKHSVTLQDNVFPLAVANDSGTFKEDQQEKLHSSIRAAKSYDKFVKYLLNDEIGIAQITVVPALLSDFPSSSFLIRLPSYENLTVHHFCHTKKGSTLFNDVIKKRLRWWKRFSNKQTNFSHQVMESKNNEMLAVAEVVHDSPSGKSIVERISFGVFNHNQNGKNIIECCTNVDQAMSAYLDDGFEERLLDEANQNKKVLRLHPSISPIKLVILTEDPSNEEQFDLANRFSKEVKTAGIMCHKLLLKEESEVYDYADAIGTPFCLKIDDMTLKRGIVGLRHRDTTVHEFMHISEVKETLIKIINL